MHPLVRLMRPALAPTAAADILAAAAVSGGARLLPLLYATVGSACLYMGGMVQNDLCDRERDARLHPQRPLVAEPRLARQALLLNLLLFALGIAFCAWAGAQWPALCVLVFSSSYNLGAKRRFPYDAVTLGAARAANLAIGLTIAGAVLRADQFTYLMGYLLFIGGITSSSRAEEMDPPPTRRLVLLLSLLPMLIGLGAFASLATDTHSLFLVPLFVLLFLFARAMLSGTREAAMRYVLSCLLAIFLVHAVCVWTRGGRLAVVPIVACAALSFTLFKAMKPQKHRNTEET